MKLNHSKYDYHKAIERIDFILSKPNTSYKDIITLEYPIIPSNLIMSESFYYKNSELAVFIRINFNETKVPLLKYKCCISEINSALFTDSIFKFENSYNIENFIFSKFDLWSFYEEKYIDSFNRIKNQFNSVLLRLCSIVDILNIKFKIKGYSEIEVKIGVSGKKLKEAEEMCLFCPEKYKIMLDKYAFYYISNLLDEKNKKLLQTNKSLNCYQGNLINNDINKWVIENRKLQIKKDQTKKQNYSNKNESNTIASYNTGYVPPNNTIKSTICPACDGDGGTRGGCYKCEGTGWITEKAKSEYYPSPETSHGRRDDSRISNYNYIGGHIGANYRDRDGSIGSIPDYDEDD